jgi:hypothetical protein
MLRIEAKQTTITESVPRRPVSAGEGMLFLGVLTVSWAIAIAVGWALWKLAPL